jgi:hypothetical protein
MVLAQALGLESRQEYIYQVMNNLPSTIKDNIEGQVTNWIMFIMAVKAIKTEKLKAQAKAEKDQVERERATKTEIDQLRAQIKKLMLVSTTGQVGQNHQIAQPTLDCTTPSISTPGMNHQLHTLAMEVEKVAIQQRLKAYPHQPDIEAGQAVYRWQLAQWTAGRNPSDIVTDMTLVPLKLGIAAICNSKCFKCGTHRHRTAWCILADNHLAHLSKEEAHWHMICRSILSPINWGVTTDIHLVFDGQGSMWQEWGIEEHELEEGKVEGLST